MCGACREFFSGSNGIDASAKNDTDLSDDVAADVEMADADHSDDNVAKKDELLKKLKSLNLPVTISIGQKPVPKPEPEVTDSEIDAENLAELDEKRPVEKCLAVKTKKKLKGKKLELVGRTVTNRCSWCGSVFHRLFLFLDHLKVCSKVPKAVEKPSFVPRPRNQSSRPALQSASPTNIQIFREQCKVCLHVYTNHARLGLEPLLSKFEFNVEVSHFQL